MSSSTAIRVEKLSKWYSLEESESPDSLRDQVAALARFPGRVLRKRRPEAAAGFWALRDVSFEVKQGQALGVVGRNGAGKSTLLKVMSRITPPTDGRVRVRGRVGSLLEVGTGFHPELSGRENVFLNGAILGMRRSEISSKFEEIVDFSGVAPFIDTPVKHYSSGMYVRLAFAVAAFLEPEILFVDEVLAVGDRAFQQRCLGKMRDAAGEGRAIIFVSHNLLAMQDLCDRALLIDDGRVVMDASPPEVVAEYVDRVDPEQIGGSASISSDAERVGSGRARARSVTMTNLVGEEVSSISIGQPFQLHAVVEALEPIAETVFEFGISTVEGQRVVTLESTDSGSLPVGLQLGTHEIAADVELALLPGEYAVDVHVIDARSGTLDSVNRVIRFAVLNVAHDGKTRWRWKNVRGFVRPVSSWSVPSPRGPS